MFDDTRPIFLQLADRIADDILRGAYAEGEQVPSTNELAAYMRINPATAGKALNLLVDREILYKKRGIGMFVADGAKTRIASERQQGFVDGFVAPLLAEARALGLDLPQVVRLVEAEARAAEAPGPGGP
ncbi:GntR family transcriptional regulator [Leucobacter sp. CSA1]|uniref:GntR family transcriptional regulator n=1 Tax=Leucobacter chromiisoli TaxID=2796471 RepID=A0A934Q551_9MICO|nr:GntR family transcriptional regulator [Leucobacter chromiisoli]MBK0417538.1 GntR family transcriptional regulator [Leucobacter chromiisoli]